MQRTALITALASLALAGCGEQARDAATNAGVSENEAVVTAAASEAEGENEVAPQHSPSADIQFASVLELNQEGSGNQPQLRGGEIARSADWPASMYATFVTPAGQSACTAALVGPSALLTAAHCVPTSGRVSFVLAGANYATQCTKHPGYSEGTDPSADFALCKVDRPVVTPPGFKHETISLAPMSGLVRTGPVILGGYGCVSDIVRERSTDGRYRIGSNTIDESSDSPAQTRGPAYYAPRQRNNLLTTKDAAVANLCPGDSGGPAFRVTGTGYAQRRIIGVNSRVFYLDPRKTSYGSSLISATGGPDFRPWATNWATSAGVIVCGVRGSVPNCR